ncbi:MAG: hypothetical protein QM758_03530 [Armatimonas sp.]
MAYTDGPESGGIANFRFEVISDAWQKLSVNLGQWVLTFLVAWLLIQTVGAVGYFVSMLPISIIFNVLGLTSKNDDPNIFVALLSFVFMIVPIGVWGAVIAVFIGTMVKMALNQLRGLPISVGDLFADFSRIVPLMVAGGLYAAGIYVGIFFCVIPAVLLAGLCILTLPLIVDQNLDGITALKTSIRIVQPQLGMAVIVGFVLMLVATLGYLVCGVGVFFTYPLLPIGLALIYKDCFPERFQQPVLLEEER